MVEHFVSHNPYGAAAIAAVVLVVILVWLIRSLL